MVKYIARSHSLGSCGQEVLLSQTFISPRQFHASETNLRTKFYKANPVIFHAPEN